MPKKMSDAVKPPTGRCLYKERNGGRNKSLFIPYRSTYTAEERSLVGFA